MLGEEKFISLMGGLARTSELYAAGFWQSLLQWSKWYGTIIHVCRGWWATPETPTLAIDARRAGGRLACVSALQLYGESEGDGQLHVEFGRSSKGPRHPAVIAHWSRRTAPGTRLAVSREVAREQSKRCPYNQSRFLNER